MLNKLGKKICAGVCALSLGFSSNVKSDALFWDVTLIVHEFLVGSLLTKEYSLESVGELRKLIEILVTFEQPLNEEGAKMKVTWGNKWKKIKKSKITKIMFGVLAPFLFVDAAKRSYERYKNLSEFSSNQKKTPGNEKTAGNKENKK